MSQVDAHMIPARSKVDKWIHLDTRDAVSTDYQYLITFLLSIISQYKGYSYQKILVPNITYSLSY